MYQILSNFQVNKDFNDKSILRLFIVFKNLPYALIFFVIDTQILRKRSFDPEILQMFKSNKGYY